MFGVWWGNDYYEDDGGAYNIRLDYNNGRGVHIRFKYEEIAQICRGELIKVMKKRRS